MTLVADPGRAACRLEVTGLVQGVGFRPFVHRLALRHGLGGWVRNASGAVVITAEGPPTALEAFVRELRSEAPPLARIESVAREEVATTGAHGFTITASEVDPTRRQPVSPDVATCLACTRELFDPADRRYRYPFITCTDCGPRYTIISAMPYDRERTSMAPFTQCPACRAEYRTPGHRRHHSETNSCPACGPQLWFHARGAKQATTTAEALARAGALLCDGRIVALRGLGGFHLAVDATDPAAVARLRRRKGREAKPFAVMVGTLDEARRYAVIDSDEAALLAGPEHPIVLVALRPAAGLAPEVAPGLDRVGLVLPYTPLHHLLLADVGRPLVMTSGNRSEEPIATGNAEALDRLGRIADGFLLHDREIVSRYDDSVVRVVAGRPVFLRRARGYAPFPLALPVPSAQPLLAVGGHLKNTFTLAHGRQAYVSQHIGDLENLETLGHLRDTVARYEALFHVTPEVAVCDLHPGYLSTRVAEQLGLGSIIRVQHHHAHIAAILAEHGERGPALGFAFDGTGYGEDGHTWGAELLVADLVGYRRLAHLRYAPLPGGDLAAREPWRAALGYLALEPGAAAAFALAFGGIPTATRALAEAQTARNLNAPFASSMGRLFDAAAAVIGLQTTRQYEGQAAMRLEALAGARPGHAVAMPVDAGPDGTWVVDPL
ncbi:MAG TPA: carbamoyltransferase HypF, partial [Gemmatimonadales bacterium]|nr:carbamoyltransferase HypF [Gemmatimonadales bacterium]